MRKLIPAIFIIVFFSLTVEAGIFRGIGANLGLISGIGGLSDSLNPGFESNIFIKTSGIIIPLEIGAGITYQTKREVKEIEVFMFPITISYVKHFWLKEYSPFVKFGAGAVWEVVKFPLYNYTNLDPTLAASFGLESKMGKKTSLRMELSYRFILQRYIENAKYNGHFVSFCVGVIWE